MRWAAAVLLFAGSGCQQIFGLDRPIVFADAPIDESIVDGAVTCLGTDAYQVCVQADALDPYFVAGATSLDTDAPCALTDPAHPDWCIVGGSDVTIDALLRATGSRPLVILATGAFDITSAGVIDVSSPHVSASTVGAAGAGANSAMCGASGGGTSSANGSGGAAGGTFGTVGGVGGKGNKGAVNGGAPAPVTGASPPATLRGGCLGGKGGLAAGTKPPQGPGGGAVYLLAGASLTIAGTINASGGGGGGGVASRVGGSGGGSGGMIALWSPMITSPSSARVFANGGGGGGGADNGAGGIDGGDPADPAVAAAGGSGGGTVQCGGGPGCGGDGSVGSSSGGAGEQDATGAGGGGGGGGAGVVYVVSGQTLASSPPSL